MESIISTLNKISRDYISADFVFHKKQSFLYVNSGTNVSTAINIRKNDSQQVNVSKWFDDFWLYIELRYVRSEMPYVSYPSRWGTCKKTKRQRTH
jgi:hypothetical protein